MREEDVMGACQYVGRVGGLAIALGIGIAVASGAAVASADEAGSASAEAPSGTAEARDTDGRKNRDASA
ncbi:hypothetical protein C6A85_71825, partial [Mycobacterium sp. ITM-2017-0098]